jgi:putative endopeptidase
MFPAITAMRSSATKRRNIKVTKSTHTRLTKRFLGVLLTLALALSSLMGVTLTADALPEYLSRAQVRDMLLATVNNYRENLKPIDIMSGYPDGELHEAEPATRIEALVMMSRAFGELPEPTGDFLRTAADMPEYTDVPGWAANYIEKLADARLLTPTEDGLLRGDVTVTTAEIDTILRRIYALYGIRLQDDFYAAVNKDWLDKSEVTEAAPSNGIFEQLSEKAYDQVEEVLDEIVNGSWKKNTQERKAADFYESIVNIDARNEVGVTPIKPYLDALDAATSLKDLESVQAKAAKDLAYMPIFNFYLDSDYEDMSKYAVYLFIPYERDMSDETVDSETSEEYRAAMEKLFKAAGDKTPAESARAAQEVAILLANATEAAKRGEETYTRYTMAQLQRLLPDADLKALYAASGLKEEDFYVVEKRAELVLKALAESYTNKNVNAVKSYLKYALLREYGDMLSQEFIEAMSEFRLTFDTETTARIALKETLPGFFDAMYVDRYFSREAFYDVMTMIDGFFYYYRSSIRGQEWMTEDTKRMAIKKLDTMMVKIGGPDRPDDLLDIADVRATADGGSYFSNMAEINKAALAQAARKQGTTQDRREWRIHTFEVNAFYNPLMNEIMFPAAILQAPFYSLDAELEENLAGIGWVIAHEITHAFDVNGSQFDELGNEADWWTESDKQKFEKLCESVVAHYDGYEVAPGFTVIGENTLGENTADLGGVGAALNFLKKEVEKPNYKLFFTAAAKLWAGTESRDFLEMSVEYDEHAPGKARVNKTLQTFKEFYDAFGIKPGDGMYISPEDRVKIW